MASRALISLFLQKYQHKMDMEEMDKQAKLKQIEDAQAFGRDLYKEEYKKDIDLRNRLLEEGRPRVNDDESPPSPQSVTAGGMTFEPPKPQLYTLGGEKFALMGGKLHKVGGKGSEKALELKIKTLEGAYPNLSHADAVGLASGTIKAIQDPVSKEAFLVDLINRKQYPLEMGKFQTPENSFIKTPPQSKAQTLWNQAHLATGPLSTVKDIGSKITGMAGGPVANETIQARQNLKSAQQNLIRSLAINDKYAVAEQNRIKEEINISPQFLDNPEHLRQRMIAVSEYLTTRYDDEIKDAYDRSLSAKTRQSSREIAKAIKHYMDMLGVPPIVKTEADYNAIKSGEEFIDDKGNRRIKK